MKKLLKISLLVVVTMAFILNLSVFAAENNTANAANNATNTSATTNEANSTNKTTTSNSTETTSSTQVTSVSSVDDDGLTMSNVLNILLIATGVVIILLAIAIFIKLK